MASRWLVTGASGFIGANLTRHLVDRGCQVTVMARQASAAWRLNDVAGLRFVPVQGVFESENVSASEFDVVVHLASSGVRFPFSKDSVGDEIDALLNLVEWASLGKNVRVINFGSSFAYPGGLRLCESDSGVPMSMYGAFKSASATLANRLAIDRDVDLLTLVPFNVYGSWEHGSRLIPTAILGALRGREVKFSSGEQMRDFVHVDDVVEAVLMAAARPRLGVPILNLSSGRATKVNEILDTVSDLLPHARFVRGAMDRRVTDLTPVSGDPSLAKGVLGWQAHISVQKGIERSANWFREHEHLYPETAS